jgi:hypothetical protein
VPRCAGACPRGGPWSRVRYEAPGKGCAPAWAMGEYEACRVACHTGFDSPGASEGVRLHVRVLPGHSAVLPAVLHAIAAPAHARRLRLRPRTSVWYLRLYLCGYLDSVCGRTRTFA